MLHSHYDVNIGEFVGDRELSLDNFKDYYWEGWEKIRDLFYVEKSGERIMKIITAYTDDFISRLYQLAVEEYLKKYPNSDTRFAVIATGGYGRGELNPFSDIDLLFLVPFKISPFVESIAERVYYALWDSGLLVGYGLRNLDECVNLGLKDSTIRTSMLDHRFLFGDRELYESFKSRVVKKLTHTSSKSFVKEKLVELEERRKKFGETLFMLEPEVKNGAGGLRDIHTAWWITRVRFKIEEWKDLYIKGIVPTDLIDEMFEAREFIWKIRNFLHFHSRRKNDHFVLPLQHDAAQFFGYKDDSKMFASEKLMKDYYKNASIIKDFADYVVKKTSEDLRSRIFVPRRKVVNGFVIVRDNLHIPGPEFLLSDQLRFLETFRILQDLDVELDLDSIYLLRKLASKIDDSLRNDPKAGRLFVEILGGKKVYEILQLMHDLKILDNYIPEFAHLFGLIQHDVYHIYTADVHSLFAVREIENLFAEDPSNELQREFKGVLETVSDIALLYMIVLFHDIGKGFGGDHSKIGSDLVKKIGERIGLDREKIERLSLLVREHLTLANFALRRDINDKNLIRELVRRVGDTENLSMLLILSYADLKSVRPDEFTEWKLSLMLELYRRALFMMESGDETGEWLKKWAGERIEKTLELLDPNERKEFEKLISEFPRRFFLTLEPPKIREILYMLRQLREEPIRISFGKSSFANLRSVTVVADSAYNKEGFFAKVSGVLRAFDCDIVEAQIYTLNNGTVVDIFHIFIPEELWTDRRKEQLYSALIDSINGKLQVEELIEKRKKGGILGENEKIKSKYPAKISIDTQSAKHFTLIEIVALDQPGLLHRLTQLFAEQHLDINYARIASFGPRIADIFYIRSNNGEKVTDRDLLLSIAEKIEEELLEDNVIVEFS